MALTFPIIALTMIAARSQTWTGMLEMFSAIFRSGPEQSARGVSEGVPTSDLQYLFSLSVDGQDLNPWAWVALAAVISFALPNAWELMHRYPKTRGLGRFSANALTFVSFVIPAFVIVYMANRVTEFFYFDF